MNDEVKQEKAKARLAACTAELRAVLDRYEVAGIVCLVDHDVIAHASALHFALDNTLFKREDSKMVFKCDMKGHTPSALLELCHRLDQSGKLIFALKGSLVYALDQVLDVEVRIKDAGRVIADILDV